MESAKDIRNVRVTHLLQALMFILMGILHLIEASAQLLENGDTCPPKN